MSEQTGDKIHILNMDPRCGKLWYMDVDKATFFKPEHGVVFDVPSNIFSDVPHSKCPDLPQALKENGYSAHLFALGIKPLAKYTQCVIHMYKVQLLEGWSIAEIPSEPCSTSFDSIIDENGVTRLTLGIKDLTREDGSTYTRVGDPFTYYYIGKPEEGEKRFQPIPPEPLPASQVLDSFSRLNERLRSLGFETRQLEDVISDAVEISVFAQILLGEYTYQEGVKEEVKQTINRLKQERPEDEKTLNDYLDKIKRRCIYDDYIRSIEHEVGEESRKVLEALRKKVVLSHKGTCRYDVTERKDVSTNDFKVPNRIWNTDNVTNNDVRINVEYNLYTFNPDQRVSGSDVQRECRYLRSETGEWGIKDMVIMPRIAITSEFGSESAYKTLLQVDALVKEIFGQHAIRTST